MKPWTSYSFARVLYSLLVIPSLALAQRAEDYKVTSLPGVDIGKLPFDQYAGHIEVSPETDGNLFFWMINQVKSTQPENLIIWLNGGPGCSSMDGLFLENGPYRVNADLALSINKYGWQDHATVVYLDQPVGTGFSFANGDSLLHNMTQVAEEFTTFLDKLMDIFPHLKSQQLYLAGESYAGTYIPYFANRILELNHEDSNRYNLKGIAIGNGWISPRHQYESYYDFSVMNKLLEGKHLESATKNLNDCRAKLSRELRIKVDVCEDILLNTITNSMHMGTSGTECINTYDIRLRNESYPSCGITWPHELTDVTKYLRTNELIKGIHSEKQGLGWQECAHTVSTALRHDPSPPADLLLPGILEEIKVLLFSGEFDLICNHLGTEYMIGNMTWKGDTGFKVAEQLEWIIDNKTVGHYIEERNLSYALIYGGSHMVPFDKPMETLDMINRFMGVGDNMVHGVKSSVGKGQQQPAPDNSPSENNDNDNKVNHTPENDDETDGSGLGAYAKSSGSYGALVVLVILVAMCACCYRFRTRDDPEKASTDQTPTSLWRRITTIIGSASGNRSTKFTRLDDQDDINELDELVGDNSTLFAISDDSVPDGHQSSTALPHTRQHQNTSASHFAIDDGDVSDDGFDDFTDWDEEATMTLPIKKNGKEH